MRTSGAGREYAPARNGTCGYIRLLPELAGQEVGDPDDRQRVFIPLRAHLDEDAVEQVDPVVLVEHPARDHLLELLAAQLDHALGLDEVGDLHGLRIAQPAAC